MSAASDAAGFSPELIATLSQAAELARREGHFELAEELAARLVEGPSLRLELLGSQPQLALARPGEKLLKVVWRLKRAFATLALLALERGRQASRETLVAALWADETPEAIRRNFHPVLSDLRRTLQEVVAPLRGHLDEVVEFHLGSYRLEPRLPLEVDVDAFEARLAAAEAARKVEEEELAYQHLQAAWSLYRGPLLEGFDGEWLQARREALHRRYLTALRRLGEMAMARGEDLVATDAFRTLLFEEPFDESLHLELMRLYARGRRRDLVRRQFVRLQENLKELDVEPLRATQEEFHRLMR